MACRAQNWLTRFGKVAEMFEIKELGEIIATRKFYLLGNKDREIIVHIGKPNQFPDFPDYYCPFQIMRTGSEKIRYAAGVDAIQALQLAMVMIGAILYTSKEAKSGQLRWLTDENDTLGFPVPE
jgi:hypothetical protein